jgi:hypothetical protein
VGDDAGGRYLLAALEAEGVDLSLTEALPGLTGRTFVKVRGGDRVFVGDDPGVQVPFHADLPRLSGGDWGLAHFSGFTSWDGGAQRCQPELADELGALTGTPLSVDFSDGEAGERLFAKVGSLLACSFFSRPAWTDREVESFITRSLRRTRGAVVVTRGVLGSAAGSSNSQVYRHGPASVPVIDTLGAGDAFIVTDKVALPHPAGVALDGAGGLLAVNATDRQVVRLDLKSKAIAPLVATNLEAPLGLARDAAGDLYVSDWGRTMCVKVFSPEGKFLRTVGKRGGRPWVGTYDVNGMLLPYGVAVDGQNRLWTVEFDGCPRRVSVWKTDGAFVREFVGAHSYAGTNCWINPNQPERAPLPERGV